MPNALKLRIHITMDAMHASVGAGKLWRPNRLTSCNTNVCEWERWLEQIQMGVIGRSIAHRRWAVMGIFSPLLLEFIGLIYLLKASLDTPVLQMYEKVNALPLPGLYRFQILKFVCNSIHHQDKLPCIFSFYFRSHQMFHSYNMWTKDSLSLRIVYKQCCW